MHDSWMQRMRRVFTDASHDVGGLTLSLLGWLQTRRKRSAAAAALTPANILTTSTRRRKSSGQVVWRAAAGRQRGAFPAVRGARALAARGGLALSEARSITASVSARRAADELRPDGCLLGCDIALPVLLRGVKPH